MKYTNIFLSINFILLIALAVFVVVRPSEGKQAYVLNEELFKGFKGKKILEAKLEKLRTDHKASMDSLNTLIRSNNNNDQLISAYQESTNKFALLEQELSDKYTADIWKEINKGVAAYGKAHGYDFVLGAAGDGSLMYANEAKNITTAVVEYLNKRYDEGN